MSTRRNSKVPKLQANNIFWRKKNKKTNETLQKGVHIKTFISKAILGGEIVLLYDKKLIICTSQRGVFLKENLQVKTVNRYWMMYKFYFMFPFLTKCKSPWIAKYDCYILVSHWIYRPSRYFLT